MTRAVFHLNYTGFVLKYSCYEFLFDTVLQLTCRIMSKLKRKLVLVSPEKDKSAKSKPTCEESEGQICLDWTKCYLCQKDTSEKLRCPLDSCKPGTVGSETYHKISERINAF